MVGIVSYGTYIPKYRIKIEDIADAWQKNPDDIVDAIRVKEKAVPNTDEDAITMGVEATVRALKSAGLDAKKLQSVFVGSESHPYAVNPSATIIAEAIGTGNNYFAVDMKFACKAATAAMQVTVGLLGSGEIEYGLVIGSDTAQAKPHDVLEYSAASLAASYILGSHKDEVIAEVTKMSSFSSNTPDF